VERLLIVNINKEARWQLEGKSPRFGLTLPFDAKPKNNGATILSPNSKHENIADTPSHSTIARHNVHLLVEGHHEAHSEGDNWYGFESWLY
jgi:hypothetical protein